MAKLRTSARNKAKESVIKQSLDKKKCTKEINGEIISPNLQSRKCRVVLRRIEIDKTILNASSGDQTRSISKGSGEDDEAAANDVLLVQHKNPVASSKAISRRPQSIPKSLPQQNTQTLQTNHTPSSEPLRRSRRSKKSIHRSPPKFSFRRCGIELQRCDSPKNPVYRRVKNLIEKESNQDKANANEDVHADSMTNTDDQTPNGLEQEAQKDTKRADSETAQKPLRPNLRQKRKIHWTSMLTKVFADENADHVDESSKQKSEKPFASELKSIAKKNENRKAATSNGKQKNIAKNSSLIEQILSSDDAPSAAEFDDAEVAMGSSVEPEATSGKNIVQQKAVSTKGRVTKTKSKRGKSVYDFESSFQQSKGKNQAQRKKEKDPAADIIQKLINEGKVILTTVRNGRLVTKRGARKVIKEESESKKLVGIAKSNEMVVTLDRKDKNSEDLKAKKARDLKAKTTPIIPAEEFMPEANEGYNYADDLSYEHIDDTNHDINLDEIDEVSTHHSPQHVEADLGRPSLHTSNHNANNREKFSRLARSVLMQETSKKSHGFMPPPFAAPRSEPKGLERMNSTPAKPHRPGEITLLSETAFSPIRSSHAAHSKTNAAASSSATPWRVPSNTSLPKVFHFSRNSANLPSFSSDFIPPTPRKDKSNNQRRAPMHDSPESVANNEASRHIRFDDSDDALNSLVLDAQSLSSGASIDSNAENMPPPPTEEATQGQVDLRQQANPRQAISKKRSPLKAINIIDVLVLPNWRNTAKDGGGTAEKNEKKACQEQELIIKNNSDLFGFDELMTGCEDYEALGLDDNRMHGGGHDQEKHSKNESHVQGDISDLFGFDEFLVESEESKQPEEKEQSKLVHLSKVNETAKGKTHHTLAYQLKKLKRLRPDTSVRPTPAPPATTTRNVIEDASVVPKQRNIKEMLCSTMIPSANANREGLEGDGSYVFQPETTFDESKPRRIYGCPSEKRKRKMHNFFGMFSDSDQSDSEDDRGRDDLDLSKSFNESDCEVAVKRKTNKKKQYGRAQKQDIRNPELEEFVDEFNSMCKDVEQYDLIVE